jgi:L-cysteine/cystine lyase
MVQATDALREHRKNFPALSNKAYFNFGGQGTLPHEALDQIVSAYKQVQADGPWSSSAYRWLLDETDKTRRVLAEQLGALPELLALTQNATEGCNIAMWGVDWRPGDHLLLTDGEHMSIVATAKQIAARMQVELTFCPVTNLPAADCAAVISKHLRPRTRLVALSHILWNTGQVLPLEEIVGACHEKGVPVLVDGAQSAGVLPLNLVSAKVDYYAITGHKWFCGPEGVGALYVSAERLPELQPTFSGWRGVRVDPQGQVTGFEEGAIRFETATAPFPLLSGLRKAIEIHDRWGDPNERYEQIIKQASRLKNGLSSIEGVRSNVFPQESGLVAFTVPSVSSAAAVKQLESRNIIVRSIPYPDCVRASVHYFSADEEIDALVAAVKDIASS